MQDRFRFRVWKKAENKMVENVTYLNPLLLDEDIAKDTAKNYVIMQCTGLKDKNGKLIYEGDIVRYAEYEIEEIEPEWEYTEIVWGSNYDYPAFDLKNHNFENNGLSEIFACGWTIEVVGNIYKNKELLNEN